MCDPITGLLGTTIFTVGGTTAAGTTAGVTIGAAASAGITGGFALTVGGALSALSTIAGLAATGVSMYKSARASKKAEAAQKAAIEKLSESNSTLEVNKTAGTVSENTTKKRTLSSLRVKQDTDAITSNVYGVDSNNTVSSSSNMVGLNIAA